MCVALALVFVCAQAFFPAMAESDGMIRVRLTRLGAPASITLAVDCDYYLAADPTVRVESGDTVTFTAGENGLAMVSGRKKVALGDTAKLMRAQSGNRGIRFLQPELSNRFCGDLGLSASGGVISAILNIYVENYLYGVVGYAMPPSADIEALKAQAVASRTYALRKKAERADAAYDVTDTASDQVYKGYNGTSDYAEVVRAVDETRGGVVYYDGSLAQCYTCQSNGGQTESARNAWGTGLNYTEVRDDPYDFESPSATVKTATVNKDLTDLNPILKTALIEGMRARFAEQKLSTHESDIRVNAIESITACDSRFPAPSRLYKSLTFKLNVSGVALDGQVRTGMLSVSIPTYGGFEDWYDLSINPEDNETVWVTESERAFNVSLRRSGSGVGMSQRGAQVMAANYGKRAQEILKYYYPGTELKQLELNDATQDKKAVEPSRSQQVIASARLGDKTDLLSAPDTDAAATATVAAGAVVDVYGVQGDWVAVGSSGKYGFVPAGAMESFALAGADVMRAEEKTYGTLKEGTQVLQLPVEGAKVLETIGGISAVRVYAWTDAWAMVETPGGQTGFAALSALDLASGSLSTEIARTVPDTGAFVDAAEGEKARLSRNATLYESADELSVPLDSLRQGDAVEVLGYSGEWVRVRTRDGKEGCVALDAVASTADQVIDGGAIHKVKGRKFMFVSAGLARVYTTWSDASDPLLTLFYGERVRVGAYNDKWACVRTDGITGFMKLEALSETRPPDIEGGRITRPKGDAYAAATRDGVSVYASWTAGAEAVGELRLGQQVRVGAYNSAWAMVRAGNIAGFVRTEDIAPSDGLQGVDPFNAIATANVKVFAAPGGSAVGQIAKGASVRVTAVKGDYALIEYNGGQGYVKRKYLKVK
ncbi:MAG: SpoIID/LytB domain-containing protein [Clostridia bacterium]|nr:SpoIID/LytB domain-containing protein [Clostridia bacterium]